MIVPVTTKQIIEIPIRATVNHHGGFRRRSSVAKKKKKQWIDDHPHVPYPTFDHGTAMSTISIDPIDMVSI